MAYKLEDILSKEEKAMREINKQKAGDNSVQIQMTTQKPKKTYKKKEAVVKKQDNFEILVRKIIISFLSIVGIILVSSLLIKFIFILFS